MRTRRLLLAASALSTLAFGCTKDKAGGVTDHGTAEPLPGNPKGTFYDDAMVTPPLPDPVAVDAATRDAPSRDAAVRPPSDAPNDAGTPRDAAVRPPSDAPNDAPRDAPPRDAAVPRDAAAISRDAAVRPLPGNPKGSRYDAGTDNDL